MSTNYAEMLRRPIAELPVYQPGRPIELVAREFGLTPGDIVKLASNENPLGPSPKAIEAVREAAGGIWLYPENSVLFLREALAERLEIDLGQLAMGAGSNEIFYMLGDLFIDEGDEAVMGESAFISYKISTIMAGGTCVEVPLQDFRHNLDAMRAAITERTKLVFLPSPNNPTGTSNTKAEVEAFARSLPDHVVFVYDEAYAEYQAAADRPDLRPLIAEGRKIVCTRTFSKIYGLAGLRIGYGYMSQELADLINRVRPPFNVGNLAMIGAQAALEDERWVERCRRENAAGLEQLARGFAQLDVAFVPSAGNFMLFHAGANAAEVFKTLQQAGVIVRPVAGYGLPQHLRVSVGTEPQNARFLRELERILATGKEALATGG